MRPVPTSAFLTRLSLVGTLVAILLVLPGVPAGADCVADDRPVEQQIAEAEVAFVGTVTELDNRDRTATFDVHEVWQHTPGAPAVGAEAVVHGGPDEPNAATSVDRTWQAGERYLVVPRVGDRRLLDDICTPTRPWSDELADARPAGTRAVAPASDLDDVGRIVPTPWFVGGVILLAVVVGWGYTVSRRRA